MKPIVLLLFFGYTACCNMLITACEYIEKSKPHTTQIHTPRGTSHNHSSYKATHSLPNSPSSRSSGYHHSTSMPTGLEVIPEGTPPHTATQQPLLPGQVLDSAACLYDTLQKTRSAPTTPRHISPSTSHSSDLDGTNTPSVDIRIAHLEVQLQKMKLELCRCTGTLSTQHEQAEREFDKRIHEQENDATKQKERIENLARRYEGHVASCSKLLCECSTSNIDCRRDIVTQTAWHDNLDTRVKTLEENVAGLILAVHEIQKDLVTIGSNERELQYAYDLLIEKSKTGALNESSVPVINNQKPDNPKHQSWHWKTLFSCCLAGSAREDDPRTSGGTSKPSLEAAQEKVPGAPNEIEIA